MECLISVIIPMYNVAPYLIKCLDSVMGQTYQNLEILAVDDGSTDETAELLRKYEKDKRFRLISQANAGVFAARNVGIDAANGEMLTFVDSDDWLEPEAYEKLFSAITKENADMAVCNFNLAYDDHIERQYSAAYDETVDIRTDVYSYFTRFCACPKPNNYLWTRLYRTKMVKESGVRFENFRLGDDTLFNFKLLPHIGRVTWISDGMYHYYQRKGSNIYTAANKGNLALVYADTFDALADYYEANGFNEFLNVLPTHAFTRMRSVFFYSRLAGMSEEQIVESLMAGFKGRKIADYLSGKAPAPK